MAEIEYYKLEQRDMLHPEKTRTVHRLKKKGRITGEQFIHKVAHRRSFSEAIITGVLINVADELAELLGEGYSVELPGVGVFSVGVRMKDSPTDVQEDDSQEESTKNARSLHLDHLNFRKNPNFFNDIRRHFRNQNIKRVYGKQGIRIKTSKYPQVKNRMIVAREFLAEHPVMTIQDYADITGLSYSAAQRELKASWQNPDYGITIMGRGSHRVYILRK